MAATVHGLHHVTAISAGARRNVQFYTRVLGLRLVKKTVNFDDPQTYHLYYGTRTGAPGTAMTFFPWEDLPPGRDGTGHASLTQFAVPQGSLGFWQRRLEEHGVATSGPETVLGETRLRLRDPDGLELALVVPSEPDEREPWAGAIGAEHAIRGFHGVTLTLGNHGSTAALLEAHLGYQLVAEDGRLRRYRSRQGDARFLDLLERPDGARMRPGAGTVHHIAFACADRAAQDEIRTALAADGHSPTPPIDRDYFVSIYFRSPGGVLFEVATDGPGFTVDEPEEALGTALRLPRQHEHLRALLERSLPALEP